MPVSPNVHMPGAEIDAVRTAELGVVARVREQAGLRGKDVAGPVARGCLRPWPCSVRPPTNFLRVVWRPALCLRHGECCLGGTLVVEEFFRCGSSASVVTKLPPLCSPSAHPPLTLPLTLDPGALIEPQRRLLSAPIFLSSLGDGALFGS